MTARIQHAWARDHRRAESVRNKRRRGYAVRAAQRAAQAAREAQSEVKEAA